MRIRTKWIIAAMSLLLLGTVTILLRHTNSLPTGRYVMQNAQHPEWAWVDLGEDNSFEFNRGSATSYRPRGTYSIEKGSLILATPHANEVYVFRIDGKALVFESGERAEGLLAKGTRFVLSK